MTACEATLTVGEATVFLAVIGGVFVTLFGAMWYFTFNDED